MNSIRISRNTGAMSASLTVRFPVAVIVQAQELAEARGVKPGRVLAEAAAVGLRMLARQGDQQEPGDPVNDRSRS